MREKGLSSPDDSQVNHEGMQETTRLFFICMDECRIRPTLSLVSISFSSATAGTVPSYRSRVLMCRKASRIFGK